MPMMRANNGYTILNGQLLQPLDMRILDALYKASEPTIAARVSMEIAKDKDGPVPDAQVISRLIDHEHLGLVKITKGTKEVGGTVVNVTVHELSDVARAALDEEASAKKTATEPANG